MKKPAILILINIFLEINLSFSQEIIPFRVNEKCGFTVKDKSGKVISHVKAQFNGLKIYTDYIVDINSPLYLNYGETDFSYYGDTVFSERPCHKDSSNNCYILDTSIVYGRYYFNKSIIAQKKMGFD